MGRLGIAVVACVACAACGRIGFGPTTDGGGGDPDARGDADSDALIDAVPDAAMLGPFGTATLISPVSSAADDDDDPTLTGDLLELYFVSQRAGGPGMGDIWVSTRTSTAMPWGAPFVAPGLNSAMGEDNCGIALDGLTIWFSSDRIGNTAYDIWTSTRPNRFAPWTPPVLVPELSIAGDDSSVAVSASTLRLLMSRGSGTRDLLESTRPTTSSTWSAPALITSLNTPGINEASAIYVSDLEVWFTSDRVGTLGLEDLWFATRPTVTSPFGAAVPVPDVNSFSTDDDAWLSPDGRLIVFTSNRGVGTYDIYQATR